MHSCFIGPTRPDTHPQALTSKQASIFSCKPFQTPKRLETCAGGAHEHTGTATLADAASSSTPPSTPPSRACGVAHSLPAQDFRGSVRVWLCSRGPPLPHALACIPGRVRRTHCTPTGPLRGSPPAHSLPLNLLSSSKLSSSLAIGVNRFESSVKSKRRRRRQRWCSHFSGTPIPS